MKGPRLNSATVKFKSQQQQRSRNLSCSSNTVRFSAHILSSRSPYELWFFFWKAETIAHSFHETKGSNSDVSNDVLASQQYQKSANNFKNQQPTMLKTSHQLFPQSTKQQFHILAYKRRHFPCIQSSWFSDQDHVLAFFLYIFVMFKFSFMLY